MAEWSPSTDDAYPPIGDYALIGDCRTAALVSLTGSVEWFCLPHFSGPAVFSAILDRQRGGRWLVGAPDPLSIHRRYLPSTNILETEFVTPSGRLRVTDLIPIGSDGEDNLLPERELLRVIDAVEGEPEVAIHYRPRPGYGTYTPRLRQRGALGWECGSPKVLLLLHADIPLSPVEDGTALRGRLRLRVGERRHLSLTFAGTEIGVVAPLGQEADRRLATTADWWHDWVALCPYHGPFREAVVRSALTLKLLTYAPSGALIAAPTASLPEVIGGVRNWDYRFCWIRDTALILGAFINLGYSAEEESFFGWLLHATRLTRPQLQVLYDIYGEARVEEYELDLEGYRGSRPVRIGNAAWDQLQLDVYGELLEAAYEHVRRGRQLDWEEKRTLAGFGPVVCRRWREPDHGIWEFRTPGLQITHSKLMCWVALDALIRLHEEGHLRAEVDRLRVERDAIHKVIDTQGYNSELGCYVSELDGREADASLLQMPRYGFIAADDPRMVRTHAFIRDQLGAGVLLRRYRSGIDTLPGEEGAFGVCAFWEVDYLARAGRLREARDQFAALLEHGNDLGLFAEEYDPQNGEALGNFPQAFTHVGLITAALTLEKLGVQ